MSGPRPHLLAALSIALSLTLSLWLGWQAVVGPAGWQHRARLARALSEVEAAEGQSRAEVEALSRRLSALEHSPRAQEQAVRDRLGWIRPGERVIHFPPQGP